MWFSTGKRNNYNLVNSAVLNALTATINQGKKQVSPGGHLPLRYNSERRYDVKGRKYIGADSKFYFEDPGIRNAILGFRQVEFNHIMENVIYNELCSRGYSVDVGLVETWERNGRGKTVRKILEVDYVVNRGSQRIYIQSAYMLPDKEKTEQEQRPLTNISDSFRKVIVSGDYARGFYNDEGIFRIGVFDFLLNAGCLDE